jgi:mRNA interferase MazF
MDRGAVVLAPFPYSNLRALKRRPACVVSSPDYNLGPDVIVAMVTSSRSRVMSPGLGDVVLQDWRAAGLRLPSVVRTGRLLVLEHRLLTAMLGALNQTDLAAVDHELRTVLGLS